MTPEQFTITLQPTPSDPRPGIVRLRSLLKLALRVCGLKCVNVQQTRQSQSVTLRVPSEERP